MKEQPVIIKSNGEIVDITPGNGKNFSLEELYKFIDTNIVQIGTSKDGRIIIMDEEGKLKRKVINVKATKLYTHGLYDPIVGDVVVCPSKYFK
jgi:hypothetical protein